MTPQHDVKITADDQEIPRICPGMHLLCMSEFRLHPAVGHAAFLLILSKFPAASSRTPAFLEPGYGNEEQDQGYQRDP